MHVFFGSETRAKIEYHKYVKVNTYGKKRASTSRRVSSICFRYCVVADCAISVFSSSLFT